MKRTTSILALVLIVALGCEIPTEPGSRREVRFETVFQGVTPEQGPPIRAVVLDEATWRATWSKFWPQGSGEPLPLVDFSRSMVIVSSKGNGACDHTQVESVVLAEHLNVSIRDRTIFGTHCACPAIPGNPVHVVVAARIDTPARFTVKLEAKCDL